MLTAKDISGLFAIIPTPAKADADRLDATDTVDLSETAKLVEMLIRDGASGLIALGTTGECATLSAKDYRVFVAHVLEVVNRRIPTLIGTSALGGHEVAERMRFIQQNRADGTLLGLPMWQPVHTDMAVDFYRQVSAVFPSLPSWSTPTPVPFGIGFRLNFGRKWRSRPRQLLPPSTPARRISQN